VLVATIPPGLLITLYVIGIKAVLAGAVHVTTASIDISVAFATIDVGADGGIGMALVVAVAADGKEDPFTFVATTVKVYMVFCARPVSSAEVVLPFAVVAVNPPGFDVTV